MSSPVPWVEAATGSFSAAPPTRVRPDACAISMTAVPRWRRHGVDGIAERTHDGRRACRAAEARRASPRRRRLRAPRRSPRNPATARLTAAATSASRTRCLGTCRSRRGRAPAKVRAPGCPTIRTMPADNDLSSLDARAGRAREGRTGLALELVDAAIERIEKVNPEINAVIHERFEAARSELPRPCPTVRSVGCRSSSRTWGSRWPATRTPAAAS